MGASLVYIADKQINGSNHDRLSNRAIDSIRKFREAG